MTKTFGWNLFTFFILLLLVEKLEIILNKHKEWHCFLCSLTLLIKMCFLISIFLCFALVPKLVPRTVDFHWYWYQILKFWYRDTTLPATANHVVLHCSIFACVMSKMFLFYFIFYGGALVFLGGAGAPAS